jgi:hypothetical protein
MPETTGTIVHYRPRISVSDAACGVDYAQRNELATVHPDKVTCFACRKTESFKATQTSAPMLLRDVMAESPEFQDLTEGIDDHMNRAQRRRWAI